MNIAKPLMIARTQLSVNSTLIVTKYGSVTILARFSADFRNKNFEKLAKTLEKYSINTLNRRKSLTKKYILS